MKKTILTLATALVVGGATLALAQAPQSNISGSSPGYYGMACCGGSMYGGMVMGRGRGMHGGWMGQGMMGRGWMRGGWMCTGTACPWDTLVYTPSGQLTQPLTKTQVQAMAEHFVASNPNLKVGKVTEKDGTYIVEIVTKKGNALVDKIAIDKTTGRMMQPVN